jgi:hypothetical protein
MEFPLLIGMMLSFIVTIAFVFMGFLGFIIRVADKGLDFVEPGEENWSALYVETRAAREARAAADRSNQLRGRKNPS